MLNAVLFGWKCTKATRFCEITMLDDCATYLPSLNTKGFNYLPLWEVKRQHPPYRILE